MCGDIAKSIAGDVAAVVYQQAGCIAWLGRISRNPRGRQVVGVIAHINSRQHIKKYGGYEQK
jgi:hypothetical protein